MTNSDYLIKATLNKISEKLNKTLLEKIEEASNAAQEVPEILKKEIENLKGEIFLEAKRLEQLEIDNQNDGFVNSKSSLKLSLEKINEIKINLEGLNDLLD